MMLSLNCLLAIFSSFIYFPSPPEEAGIPEQIETAPAIHLKGVVLVSDVGALDKIDPKRVNGLYIDKNVSFNGSVKGFQNALEPLFDNQIINRTNLLLIKNTILKYCSDNKQHMMAVEIPEQDITAGVVAFVITPAKTGKITFHGARWFSEKRIEKTLDLHEGENLDEDHLLNNLSWLNENPFHYTEAVLSPGKLKLETDLEIVTKDRFPLRLYTGADNTGVESTGRGRYYGGATWGNAFWVDDLLTYQFTSNSDFNKFHSQSLNYTSFLPWQHIFMIYGGYSKIEPDVEGFVSHGKEAQASVRYKIPFKPLYTKFQHQFSFGFDYKYITSDLFFVSELDSTTLMNAQANVTQAMLGYLLEYKAGHHQATFRLEFFGSPAKWISHQTNGDYAALRFHAMPRYAYATAALGDIYTFDSKYSISALVRAQASTSTLIPSEQFKLGGYNTVRGYEESVFISDNGVCLNVEFRSRPFSLIKKWKDELTLLAFADYGWGHNYHPFDGITTSAVLVGVGPGMRYNINPYLMLRADYGFRLHKIRFDEHGLGMWHLSATLSY